jgi:uncharacterized membrane protein YhaH (DUF805 family)
MSWGAILFSFYGRINRAKYWAGALMWLVFFLILMSVIIGFFVSDIMALTTTEEVIAYALGRGLAVFLIVSIVSIIAMVSGLALGVKRLHDRDKSGWWIVLFYVVPEVLNGATQTTDSGAVLAVGTLAMIGLVIWGFIELGCLRGTAGPNRFGPDPLALPRS